MGQHARRSFRFFADVDEEPTGGSRAPRLSWREDFSVHRRRPRRLDRGKTARRNEIFEFGDGCAARPTGNVDARPIAGECAIELNASVERSSDPGEDLEGLHRHC